MLTRYNFVLNTYRYKDVYQGHFIIVIVRLALHVDLHRVHVLQLEGAYC